MSSDETVAQKLGKFVSQLKYEELSGECDRQNEGSRLRSIGMPVIGIHGRMEPAGI
jgi:hypothetical protein